MTEQLLPPHSIEAEECVIGSVLIDPGLLDSISLDPDDFFIHRNRFVWAAIMAVRDGGLSVDYVTLTNELERRHQLVEIGGAAAITGFMANVPNVYNAESYAEVIRQNAVSRQYLDLANTIANQATNGGVDVAAALEVLTNNSTGQREGRHIAPALDDLASDIVERCRNPVDVWGIPTGFIDLDKRTGGLHKEQVFILSGESGTGKTTIMLQAALHAAKQGHGVAIFEKEMSEPRTLRRLVELETSGEVTNRAMQSGRMEEHHWTFFTHAQETLSSLPIFINDDPVSTTADIRGIIARARTRQRIDAVYLDYLSLLGDQAPGNTQDYDQTKAQRFRTMCREMDVAGFTIQDMVKFEGAPRLVNMSGGAKVRFSADVVYFIVQDTENKSLHYLTPAKERDGDLSKDFVALTRDGLAFVNATTERVHLS